MSSSVSPSRLASSSTAVEALPRTADEVHNWLLLPDEPTRRRRLLRYEELIDAKCEICLLTKFELTMLGEGPTLLRAGDDLCDWHDKTGNRGYSVLNLPPLRRSGHKLKSQTVRDLLAQFPRKMAAAVRIKCPQTGLNDDARVDKLRPLGGQEAAYAWVHDLDALRAFQDFGVDFPSLQDDRGRTLLHTCASHQNCRVDVLELICNSVQPKRQLRRFLQVRDSLGRTAAETFLLGRCACTSCRASAGASNVLRLLDPENELRLERSSSYANQVDEARAARDCYARAEASLQSALLGEFVAVVFTGAAAVAQAAAQCPALHAPLTAMTKLEAMHAELQRWQKSDACGNGGGGGGGGRSRGGSANGKRKRSADALPCVQMRSVSVGDTAREVVEAYICIATLPREKWSGILDDLALETLLDLASFVDRFLFQDRAHFHPECKRAIRDAVPSKKIGDRILEGVQQTLAIDGDSFKGEYLVEALIPWAVENYSSTASSAWLAELPSEVTAMILKGVTSKLEASEAAKAALIKDLEVVRGELAIARAHSSDDESSNSELDHGEHPHAHHLSQPEVAALAAAILGDDEAN